MPVTTVTREQLYERLWQTPTVHLCKEFGLSDVGLAKLCKRHKIPKPYLGYWARKAAGANPSVPAQRQAAQEPDPGRVHEQAARRAGDADHGRTAQGAP